MARKEKKVDYEALNSPFMRIPRMNVRIARALLNIGLRETYELVGRSPDVIFEESRRLPLPVNEDDIGYFRMAVYFAETENPDPGKLHPSAWRT